MQRVRNILFFGALFLLTLLSLPLFAGGSEGSRERALERHLILFVSDGPAVQVLVDGETRIEVPARGQMAVRTHRDHLKYLVIHGDKWQYAGFLDLRAQTERLVMISAPSAHLKIINRGAEDAQILFESQSLGILPRDGVRLLGPLPSGRRRLVAIGVRSRSWSVLDITLTPGGLQTAVLPPASAGLQIENTLREVVRVSVDEHDYGMLKPARTMTVLGLAPGSHQVSLLGLRTAHRWRYESDLKEEGSSSADAGPLRLWLDNQTGETLHLPSSLGGLYDRPILAGQRVALTMKRKSVRLTLSGEVSGLSYRRDVSPDPAEQSWVLHRPFGQLRLINGTGEDVEIDVGGVYHQKLEKAAKVQLRFVPAGKLSLRVSTKDSGLSFERRLFLEPQGDIAWTVTAGAASLIVRNEWPESMELELDGSPRGHVLPGKTFRVGAVRPGVHKVIAKGARSGRVDAALVQIIDGKRTTLVLRPPEAALQVINDSDERYDLLVAGARAGAIPPGESRVFGVSPGRVVAEVRGATSGLSASWLGTLMPGQQLPMPAPMSGGGVIELLNDRPVPVWVKIDSLAPVQVASGKQVRLKGLRPGEHLIEIKGEGFEQRRRIKIVAGLPAVKIALLPVVIKDKDIKGSAEAMGQASATALKTKRVDHDRKGRRHRRGRGAGPRHGR